jgi:hypothetical protein
MKKISILLGCFLILSHASAGEKVANANKSIILTIQKNRQNIAIGAYAFCVPELISTLQRDTATTAEFYKSISTRLSYLKAGYTEDVYLSELLQVQLLQDSLSSFYSNHKEGTVKRLLDSLKKVSVPKVQKNKYYLFFKSFTDESGVGALKIETLLLTQDLQSVFAYIQGDEMAKDRFLRWVNEEVEVWCPSFSTGNTKWDNRIVQCLYDRLREVNHPLAQQAITKMKQWFGNDLK